MFLLLAIAACSSTDLPENSPLGSLKVTTVTGGTGTDPDGYNLMLDSVVSVAIGTNGSATVPNLTPGDIVVELTNVAGNCTVSDPQRRTLTIQDDVITQAVFAVNCVP